MSSIITHQLRRAIADAIYDDIFSRRNNYYYFFGRYLDTETVPDAPSGTIEYDNTTRDHIVAAKKIYVSDVAFIVPRFDWVSGSSYPKYNTLINGNVTKDNVVNATDLCIGATATILTVGSGITATDFTAIGAANNTIGTTFTATGSGTGTGTVIASGPKFYVYDDVNYRVYKCIDNNNGVGASTVRPTSTEAYNVTYSDGYTWRYMYSLPKSIRNKFLTATHLPVFTALQKRYYSDGGLGDITIVKAGANYTQSTAVITVSGDGSGAVLEPVIVNGQLGDIIVKNPGRDYTRAVLVISDSGSGSGAEAVVELNTGDLDSDQALVELLTTSGTVDTAEVLTGGAGYVTATVKVIGDGTGATAQATIFGGVITKIIITNKGEGYSYASLVITPQNTPAITAAATTRVNVSPFLGHGRNAVDELFADQLMFYSNITSDRLADFDVVTPYKQFGIIKNLRNLDYTSNIYDQVSPNRYQVEADFGPQVTFVGGGGVGAKGRVNVTGNYVSDVRIESAGAGYTSTPTVSFGKQLTITGSPPASRTSTVATANFAAQPVAPYPVGSSVIVTGLSPANFNGTFVVTACTTTSVSWADTNGAGNATGTGTVVTSGSGATAVATIDAKLNTTSLTYGGVGYASAPGVTLSATDGRNGAITATTSLGVGAVTITDQGSGYATVPTVAFTGGTGSVAAQATAVVSGGKVVKVIVTNPGQYSVIPTGVTFSGGGAAAGTAISTFTTNALTISNIGTGYTVTPTLTFNGSCGVSDVVVDDPGTGFYMGANPAITFKGGGGNGLAATAYVNNCVRSTVISNAGSGYVQAGALIPTTTFTTITGNKPVGTVTSRLVTQKSSSGSGTGATFTITTTGSGLTYTGVTTITLVSAGSGYAVGNTVTISGSALGGLDSVNDLTFTLATAVGALPVVTFTGSGTNAAGTAVVSGGKVVGITITNRGAEYVPLGGILSTTTFTVTSGVKPTATVTNAIVAQKATNGSGTGIRLRITTTGTGSTYSGVTTISIVSAGSGYTTGNTVTIDGASLGGTTLTNDLVITLGTVSASNTTVTIAAPTTGTTATASAILTCGISHINLTNPGTGYTSAPIVDTVENNGLRTGYKITPVLGKATGSATVTGYLKSITLTGNGSGYTSAPAVVLSGGSPTTAAVAYSKVVGEVTSITIDEGGAGYSTRPSVIIYGGEGSGASYIANINSTTGKVTSCTKIKGGSNYVITKFADFTIGTTLIDTQLNEYVVYSAKTNLKNNSLIITSNNGYPVVGRMTIRKKNASDYFITNTALSQKFLESRFPVACYKVRGGFTLLNYPANTTVTLTDSVNGNKTFIVISSKTFDTGVNEMLLMPIDGGTLNNGVTLTNGSNPFSVISYDEPALDRRTGDLLMIANNSSSFTQNSDQTLSFRTIINF
jgi:hypothetical protein